jgi:serine/threonine-protein kinase RsbW
VQVSAKDCRCAIEVVNTSGTDGEPVRVGALAVTSDPVPEFAEHGRGLKIIDAVADNLQLTGDDGQRTVVHFEKTLKWLPGAPGQHLISTDSAR